jgi:high-affinity Fe2+/Pb2+ permease
MIIYTYFVHIHSVLRWLILVFLIAAIVNSIVNLSGRTSPKCKDCAFKRLVLIVAHLQLVFGLVLYFISPKVVFAATSMKDAVLRFFLVEHIGLMIVAVILITVGYVKSERAVEGPRKYKTLLVYYSIALVLILASIPWPFRGLGAAWF